jgi:DNA-binding NarL/FixJ family response regulator
LFQMAEQVRPSAAAAVKLSRRQSEVLGYIVDGFSDNEIAERIGISPRTVRMHADALRGKLGVAHRRRLPAAYRDALEHGLIKRDSLS